MFVKSFRSVVCVLVLSFGFSTVIAAQERHALVMGNAAYKGMSPLKNPVNDATDIALALEGLGFTVDLVKNASLAEMETAVVSLGERLKKAPGSWGFFYYAGHGVQSSDGENYLIPVDANIPAEAFLKSRALPNQVVLDILQESRNALNVIILDACRDNPFSWSRSASRGLSVVRSQPPGSIIAYATSAGSVAQDGTGRNGLFTAQLLKNLTTRGLEIKDVFNRTGKGVQEASGSKQVPAVYNQFFDTAYLAGEPEPVKAEVTTVIERVVVAANADEVPGGPWYRSTSFETGQVSPWGPRAQSGEVVELSNDEYRSGAHSLKVSKRTLSYHGIKGPLLSKEELKYGWEVNAWVKYTEGPPSALIQSTVEFFKETGKGLLWIPVAPTIVRKGEWTLLSGCFKQPDGLGAEGVILGFETCFREGGVKHPENTLSFWVDDLSLRKLTLEATPPRLVFAENRKMLFSDQTRSSLAIISGSALAKPGSVTWLSSEPSVALVTPTGDVMGIGPGTCYILATDRHKQQAAIEVEVLDAGKYTLFTSYDFQKKSQVSKFTTQRTADYSVNPPKYSSGVLKLVHEKEGGAFGDGALRLDFERENFGFVDINLRMIPGARVLPEGTIIMADLRGTLPDAFFRLGLISGDPDWKWFEEDAPYAPVYSTIWSPVIWILKKPFRMAQDGEVRIVMRKENSSKQPGEKGSVWVDSFKIWVPVK